MKKILLYPFSVLFYVLFYLTLGIFHPLLWLAHHLGGYNALKKMVDCMNGTLLLCLLVVGNTSRYTKKNKKVPNQPVIIISNHQTMFDIVLISWYMRRFHPKFVSKIELGKGFPSVSFNLRNGGSVLIDRKNSRQSLPALTTFGKYIATTNRAAVIFPEGTRSKTGAPKPYSVNGLKILLKYIPNAMVIPITINNSWKLFQYGAFPIRIGLKLTLDEHPALYANKMPQEELLAKAEALIKKHTHF